ncbi:MAG: hypothetical protein M3O07_10240 [Pseudomonadota bacterium]|nr:hypothetical protein [Pseudomonadota bacterium]
MTLLLAGVGQADDENVPDGLDSDVPRRPLDLLLTREELRAIVHRYEIRTGEVLTAPIDEDEVVVTGTRELAPMRDASQDMWGGVAAPFWALMNPRDAWRIFVPVPPKGAPKEAER